MLLWLHPLDRLDDLPLVEGIGKVLLSETLLSCMNLTVLGFGSDPYIAGILAAVSIDAIHKRGVMTSTKVRYP